MISALSVVSFGVLGLGFRVVVGLFVCRPCLAASVALVGFVWGLGWMLNKLAGFSKVPTHCGSLGH